MKLLVLSDLHVEFAPFVPDAQAVEQADVVVLAGDIHKGAEGLRWASEAFGSKPIVYVAGNHEFYGGRWDHTLAKMRQAATTPPGKENAMSSDQPGVTHVDALIQVYPRLFGKGVGACGVWFPAGWTAVMNRLCRQLNELLTDAQANRFRVEQVKEKFGGLRFYYSVVGRNALTVDVLGPDGHLRIQTRRDYPREFPTEQVDALIALAEADSKDKCMYCGGAGMLRTQRGWWHVACDACEARHIDSRRKGGAP